MNFESEARDDDGEKEARQFTSGHWDGGASNSSLPSARAGSFPVFCNVRHQRLDVAGRTFRALMVASTKTRGRGQARSLIGVYGRKISFFLWFDGFGGAADIAIGALCFRTRSISRLSHAPLTRTPRDLVTDIKERSIFFNREFLCEY